MTTSGIISHIMSTKNAKRYRFFYHYRKMDGRMTVHFRNQCMVATDVKCQVPCETKRNKRQPHLVMQGYCKSVDIAGDVARIQ